MKGILYSIDLVILQFQLLQFAETSDTFDEKVLQKQMTDLKKKNKILSKQVNQLHRTLQYVRNRTWTLLEENFIPELEKLELQMRETLEKYEEMAWDLHQK